MEEDLDDQRHVLSVKREAIVREKKRHDPAKEMIKLLDKSIRAAELAHGAYTRYSQNPHTQTGQKALARYERWDLEYADAVDELRAKIREAFES